MPIGYVSALTVAVVLGGRATNALIRTSGTGVRRPGGRRRGRHVPGLRCRRRITGQAIGIGGDRLTLWSHPAQAVAAYADGGWTADAVAEVWPTVFAAQQQSVGEQLPEPPAADARGGAAGEAVDEQGGSLQDHESCDVADAHSRDLLIRAVVVGDHDSCG
jgi:hypothetical protein